MAKKQNKKPNGEKKPLSPEYIKLRRFTGQFSKINSELWDRSEETIESLRSGKFTKDKLLSDFRYVVNALHAIKQEAEQIIIKYPRYSELTTDALVLGEQILNLLWNTEQDIELLKDIDKCYELHIKAYKRAPKICYELGKVIQRLDIKIRMEPPGTVRITQEFWNRMIQKSNTITQRNQQNAIRSNLSRLVGLLSTKADEKLPAGEAGTKSQDIDTDMVCKHSDDFTSVIWYDQPYNFNMTQARCVKLLWCEWQKQPGLSLNEYTIAEKINSENNRYRLKDTFRNSMGKEEKMHPAWGKMIQRCGPKKYRLGKPDTQQ